MRGESDPAEGVDSRESSGSGASDEGQEPKDFLTETREKIADFRGYDELAVEQFVALNHYVGLRQAGMPLAQAAALVCETYGHDAPRGLCRRCGLGVDLTDESRKRDAERMARRDEFLASRH